MKYLVMNKGHVVLRTDDREEARTKVAFLEGSTYIHYGPQARQEYQTSHKLNIGEKE